MNINNSTGENIGDKGARIGKSGGEGVGKLGGKEVEIAKKSGRRSESNDEAPDIKEFNKWNIEKKDWKPKFSIRTPDEAKNEKIDLSLEGALEDLYELENASEEEKQVLLKYLKAFDEIKEYSYSNKGEHWSAKDVNKIIRGVFTDEKGIINEDANSWVNFQGADGSTFLLEAFKHGDMESCQALLFLGADPWIENHNGESVISLLDKSDREFRDELIKYELSRDFDSDFSKNIIESYGLTSDPNEKGSGKLAISYIRRFEIVSALREGASENEIIETYIPEFKEIYEEFDHKKSIELLNKLLKEPEVSVFLQEAKYSFRLGVLYDFMDRIRGISKESDEKQDKMQLNLFEEKLPRALKNCLPLIKFDRNHVMDCERLMKDPSSLTIENKKQRLETDKKSTALILGSALCHSSIPEMWKNGGFGRFFEQLSESEQELFMGLLKERDNLGNPVVVQLFKDAKLLEAFFGGLKTEEERLAALELFKEKDNKGNPVIVQVIYDAKRLEAFFGGLKTEKEWLAALELFKEKTYLGNPLFSWVIADDKLFEAFIGCLKTEKERLAALELFKEKGKDGDPLFRRFVVYPELLEALFGYLMSDKEELATLELSKGITEYLDKNLEDGINVVFKKKQQQYEKSSYFNQYILGSKPKKVSHFLVNEGSDMREALSQIVGENVINALNDKNKQLNLIVANILGLYLHFKRALENPEAYKNLVDKLYVTKPVMSVGYTPLEEIDYGTFNDEFKKFLNGEIDIETLCG